MRVHFHCHRQSSLHVSWNMTFSLLCILVTIISCYGRTDASDSVVISNRIMFALDAYEMGDIEGCLTTMKDLLRSTPDNVDINQVIGSLYVKFNETKRGVERLYHAIELSEWQEPHIIANYIESLRIDSDLELAWTTSIRGLELHPSNTHVLFNAGIIARDMKDYFSTSELMRQTVARDRYHLRAWVEGGDAMIANSEFVEAELFLQEANGIFPDDAHLLASLGISKHHQGKFHEALFLYNRSIELKEDSYDVKSFAATALQSLGRSKEAAAVFESCLPFRLNDAGIRCNYGILLIMMGEKEEGLIWLMESLEINPTAESTLTNIGGHYQDDGSLDLAKEYLSRAAAVSQRSTLLHLRIAVMLSPIASSWSSMVQERRTLEAHLSRLLSEEEPVKHALDSALHRIHFYLVYHGVNDRPLQEMIVRAYERLLIGFPYIHPKVKPSRPGVSVLRSGHTAATTESLRFTGQIEMETRSIGVSLVTAETVKVRVAFMSLFFGIFEPHGMLLDGVMKLLPRSQFEVICFPVVRTDGKPLSRRINESCDHVVEVGLSHSETRDLVISLDIDILVFADTMSEPMTHFLSHSRLASIQVPLYLLSLCGVMR